MARSPGFIKRAPRVDLRQRATILNSDGAVIEAVLLDLSSSGFKIQAVETLRIGEFVTLRVGRSSEMKAQIRWALGDQAGGVFINPVDQSELQ
jgi:phosphoribosylformylglycinamidine (FGAM) synthase PurS component